jgi:putative transcriptional regulator
MIKIYLSRLLGEKRITQAELSRKTKIRAATINEIYHELCDRVNLEHLDLICKALDCKLSDLIDYVPDERRAI